MKRKKISATVLTILCIIAFFLIIFSVGRLIYVKTELVSFTKEYIKSEDKQFIYNEGIYNFWSDEQIENFNEVKDGEINAEKLKEERNALKNTINEIVQEIPSHNYKEIAKIIDSGIVKIGFILDDDYLYIYENNTMLLKKGNVIISYNINDVSKLVEKYINTKEKFEINPYY